MCQHYSVGIPIEEINSWYWLSCYYLLGCSGSSIGSMQTGSRFIISSLATSWPIQL